MGIIIAKEVYTGAAQQTDQQRLTDVRMKIITADNQEVDIHFPRDIAIDLVHQIYAALERKGLQDPSELN